MGFVSAVLAVLVALLVLLVVPSVEAQGNLYSQGRTFSSTDRFIGAHVFHWYTPFNTQPGDWQANGAWQPLEGRQNWDGSVAFFKRQIKDMMDANLDVIYVELMDVPEVEQQRINLFRAYAQLRAEGYDPPKIAVFLDGFMTWGFKSATINFATASGKNALVDHYKRFYDQYFAENTDPHADSYLAQIDGRLIINNWHLIQYHGVQNATSLTRNDVESRLRAAYGAAHPVFNNGVYWINTAHWDDEMQSWTDERFHQFSNNNHFATITWQGKKTAMLKPGFWNENYIPPPNATFLPRNGGSSYNNAWNQLINTMNGSPPIRRVVIESWNEYSESTGLYEGDPGPPFIHSPPEGTNPGTNTDSWSSSNNPREYIDRTATRARQFTGLPERDAKILWSNVPTTVSPNQTFSVTVIVRNEGTDEWRASKDYKLGIRKPNGFTTPFSPTRVLINDGLDEIPRFGGIFRSRPKTFTFNLTAPSAPGTYSVQFQMVREFVAWFGEPLVKTITVSGSTSPPATATLNLGTNDVIDKLRRPSPEPTDGDTVSANKGGRNCRRIRNPAVGDRYMYFRVDDSFALRGSRPTVDIEVTYFDNATGIIFLQYDGSGGAYSNGGIVSMTGTNTWKTHTFTVNDAYFGNRQNRGSDFRVYRSHNAFMWLDVVRVID
ncbi:MAG: hypothetical protein AAF604_01790 [Acidobacteriota bacterium]